MKVFISWSGSASKAVAELLKPWIKCVLQATEPFISTEDIDKGSVWFTEINAKLSETKVGIICLTPDNLKAEWILFEAGAIAKGVERNRVCTVLINLTPTNLRPPLSQFNATSLEKKDMLRLFATINSALGEKALQKEILEETFATFWDGYKAKIDAALAAANTATKPQERPDREILEEILQTCRSLQKGDAETKALVQALAASGEDPWHGYAENVFQKWFRAKVDPLAGSAWHDIIVHQLQAKQRETEEESSKSPPPPADPPQGA